MLIAAWIVACCLQAPTEITVDVDRLTLGAILPLDQGDPRAAVVLGYAPQPGLARRFTRPELLSKVTAAGMPAAGLDLPVSILVRRKAEMLDPGRVRLAIQEAFARQYPEADVSILSMDIPQSPLGGGPIELTAGIPPRSNLTAPLYVRLDIQGPGFTKSLFVRTVASVVTPQLVLRNPVPAGTALQPSDVELRAAAFHGLTAPLSTLESLEGFVAARDLRAGQTLTPDLLRAPLLVRRGESVTVRAASGGVTIAATMRAKSDGRFGDTIAVEHLSGGGVTSARIVGSRVLEASKGVR